MIALQMQLNARETRIKEATVLMALLAHQDHEFWSVAQNQKVC